MNFLAFIDFFSNSIKSYLDYFEHKFLLFDKLKSQSDEIKNLKSQNKLLEEKIKVLSSNIILDIDFENSFFVNILLSILILGVSLKFIKIYIYKKAPWLYDFSFISLIFKNEKDVVRDLINKEKEKIILAINLKNSELDEFNKKELDIKYNDIIEQIKNLYTKNKDFINLNKLFYQKHKKDVEDKIIFFDNIFKKLNNFILKLSEGFNRDKQRLQNSILDLNNLYTSSRLNYTKLVNIFKNIQVDAKYTSFCLLILKYDITEISHYLDNDNLYQKDFDSGVIEKMMLDRCSQPICDINIYVDRIDLLRTFYCSRYNSNESCSSIYNEIKIIENNFLDIIKRVNVGSTIDNFNYEQVLNEFNQLKECSYLELDRFLDKYTTAELEEFTFHKLNDSLEEQLKLI